MKYTMVTKKEQVMSRGLGFKKHEQAFFSRTNR